MLWKVYVKEEKWILSVQVREKEREREREGEIEREGEYKKSWKRPKF